MSFSELIGNEKIKETLTESAQSSNVLHSYMFYGTEGIGKKLFGIEFARMLLCESDDKPCGKCKSCIEFDSNNNPDYFFVEPDKGTLKIDQIRELQRNMIEKPVNGLKKVYIINDADTMTKEAQNCLLKTLEEPSDFIVIILICANENSILPTVKSRCTKIFFKDLTEDEIKAYISEKNISANIDEDMIELCGGSISRINTVIEKKIILDEVKECIDSVGNVDEIDFLNKGNVLYDNKDDIYLMLEYVYVLLSKKINKRNINKCANSMQYVQNAKKKIRYSNNYDMTIDNMLIKMWGEFNEKDNRG